MTNELKTNRPPFVMFNPQWMKQYNMHPYEVALYIALNQYANWTTKVAFPSHKTLADTANIGVSSVKKHLSGLIEKGFIKSEIRHPDNPAIESLLYTILDPTTPSHNTTNPSSQNGHTPSHDAAINKIKGNKNKGIKEEIYKESSKPPTAPQAKAAAITTEAQLANVFGDSHSELQKAIAFVWPIKYTLQANSNMRMEKMLRGVATDRFHKPGNMPKDKPVTASILLDWFAWWKTQNPGTTPDKSCWWPDSPTGPQASILAYRAHLLTVAVVKANLPPTILPDLD